MATNTGFPQSSIAIIDPKTGLATIAFWRLLENLWRRAGGWEDALSDFQSADANLAALIQSLAAEQASFEEGMERINALLTGDDSDDLRAKLEELAAEVERRICFPDLQECMENAISEAEKRCYADRNLYEEVDDLASRFEHLYTSLLFTTEELLASSESSGMVTDGDKGDITVSGGGTVWTIDADVVTYNKMQDTSSTDVILGRFNAGGGTIEEIACTSAGRALLDDASASDQRTTLGLGTIAVESYEEGSYTPELSFATPGTSSFSYVTRFGRYTTIGNQTIVETFLNFTPTLGTASGSFRISIPVTAAGSAFGGGTVRSMSSAFSWGGGTDIKVAANSSVAYVTLRADASGAVVVEFAPANLTNGASHNFSFVTTVRTS